MKPVPARKVDPTALQLSLNLNTKPQGKGLDCKGVCNAPASKTIFRMKMPTMANALAGKWPGGWVSSSGRNYEEMPIGRVFADAVLLPNGQVRVCAVCCALNNDQRWDMRQGVGVEPLAVQCFFLQVALC